MAINQKQQLIVIVVGVVVAAYMGYTTLFPNTASTYAEQSAEPVVVKVSPATQPNEAEQETLPDAEPTEQLNAVSPQTELHAQMHTMVSKVNRFLEGEMSSVEPFRLDVNSANILAQSQSITNATMKAKLREQNQKHQVEKNTHKSLGINAPMAVSAPITGSAEAKTTSYPVYLFRMGEGPTIARIQYKEQWVKVHPGMELGTIKVLRITSKGVTIRENGKTRLLTPRDS